MPYKYDELTELWKQYKNDTKKVQIIINHICHINNQSVT